MMVRQKPAVLILGILVCMLTVLCAVLLINKLNKQSGSSARSSQLSQPAEDEVLVSDGPAVEENRRSSENLVRKNDAQRIAQAVAEFINNNKGMLPTGWHDSSLVGESDAAPQKVTDLNTYRNVTVTTGAQPALRTDSARIVTRALCGEQGAAIDGPTARNYVVQYAFEQPDGSFISQCIEG